MAPKSRALKKVPYPDATRDEPVIDGDDTAASGTAPEKSEKSKNPFSNLRKKTSSMML